MVAIDVATRGVDIPCVAHVINYDLPRDIEHYVHWIGQTGRAGKSGIATAFFCDKDRPISKALAELMKEANQTVPGTTEVATLAVMTTRALIMLIFPTPTVTNTQALTPTHTRPLALKITPLMNSPNLHILKITGALMWTKIQRANRLVWVTGLIMGMSRLWLLVGSEPWVWVISVFVHSLAVKC